MEAFTVDQFSTFLAETCAEIDEETILTIKNAKVTGKRALRWGLSEWQQMGVSYGDVLDIMAAISDYKDSQATTGEATGGATGEKSTAGPVGKVGSRPATVTNNDNATESEVTNTDNATESEVTNTDMATDPEVTYTDKADADDSADSLDQYFSDGSLSEISPYEKQRFRNIKTRYENGIKRGLNVKRPDFMTKGRQTDDSQDSEKEQEQPEPQRFFSVLVDNELPSCSKSAKKVKPVSTSEAGPSSTRSSKDTTKSKTSKKPAKVRLSEAELAASLPNFDVVEILNGMKGIKAIKRKLAADGIVYKTQRKELIRRLTKWLHYEHVSEIKLVTMDMKEGLAASIIAAYPKYKDPHPSKPSWWRLLDREGPSGWIANCTINILRSADPKDRQRGGGSKRRWTCDSEESGTETENENEKDKDQDKENTFNHKEAEWMNLTMPCSSNKRSLRKGMQDSFAERNRWIKKTLPTVAQVLDKYVHLMSFEGEMLVQEFQLLFPDKGNCFSQQFPVLLEKLTDKFQDIDLDVALEEDESRILKACLYIANALPRPNLARYKQHKSKRKSETVMPLLDSLVQIISVGCNIETLVQERRDKSKGPVQPYLLALVPEKSVTKQFLVADSRFIQLGSASLLAGLDMLFKTYHVFNVDYPLGWKGFWELVERGVVGIMPHTLSNSSKEFLVCHQYP